MAWEEAHEVSKIKTVVGGASLCSVNVTTAIDSHISCVQVEIFDVLELEERSFTHESPSKFQKGPAISF